MPKILESLLSPASPLQAYWQGEQPANNQSDVLQLQEASNLSMILIQGHLESSNSLPLNEQNPSELSLSNEPNQVSGHNPACVWLAPGQWLLIGSDTEETLIAQLQTALPPDFHITPVSGSRCAIDISGAAARQLLNSGCGLDFNPTVFTVGRSAQTLFAQLDVLIYSFAGQLSDHSTITYRLLVSRGEADYVWRWLKVAAREKR
mgnify:CR=1 FL=1